MSKERGTLGGVGAHEEQPNAMQRPPPEQPITWLTPGRLFLFSSIPLGIGTYIGYRRALAETTSTNNHNVLSRNSLMSQMIHFEKVTPPQEIKVNAPLLAVRALAVGSLLSISATSLLISSIFYAADAHSVEELISKWRLWAPSQLRRVESLLGIKNDRSEVRRYERDVRGMSEEEEWDYVTQKYGSEIRWEEDETSSELEK